MIDNREDRNQTIPLKKKNIIFFSRSELTYLYGSVHKYLANEFNLIHVAYSIEEAAILKSVFNITDVIVFKEITRKYLSVKTDKYDLEIIDSLLIEQTSGSFNFNAMLQSNRTSKNIGYDNTVQLANIYYNTWVEIFKERAIDFFVHEPVSLMMNQIAAAICKEQGGVYTTHILVHGDNSAYNFIMLDHYNGLPIEIKRNYDAITIDEVNIQKERTNSFLKKFRSSYDVFFSALGSGGNNLKLQLKLVKNILSQQIRAIKPTKFHPILDNIEIFLEKDNLSRRRLGNINSYKQIKYSEFDPTVSYYFYPLHLEPEAVVLYWADGYYTNQIKLIENIAAQLPPGNLLYVKDHPHLYGYRDKIDYDRIQNIPNARLLAPSLSGKQIIKDCLGVITINGTGGFEALLMNKHVITFGSAFYAINNRVKYVKDIKGLRDVLYDLNNVVYEDDEELKLFVLAYLKSQKEGFTDFYGGMHKVLAINLDSNGALVAKGLKDYFDNYKNYNGV